MRSLSIFVLTALTTGFLADTAWSKGAISRIVIDGDRMPEAIEIVDPDALREFTIWSGPGVGGWESDGSAPTASPGFIADWASRLPQDERSGDDRLSDPHVYRVTFYLEGREPPRNTYEVLYEVDDDVPRGYVYLPSYPDDDFGQWNTFQIYRGVEGNWFYATQAWDELVRPLISKE